MPRCVIPAKPTRIGASATARQTAVERCRVAGGGVERPVEPDVACDILAPISTKLLEISVFTLPSRVWAGFRRLLFDRPAGRQNTGADGEGAGTPFTQRIDMSAAF